MNRKNNFNLPVFHVSGTNGSKPDLLVINKQYKALAFRSPIDGIPVAIPTCFMVELKTGEHLGDILEGVSQLQKYWARWVAGEVIYSTDTGKVVKGINYFLLATRLCPFGYMYKEETQWKPGAWPYISDVHHFLEYPISKTIESMVFNAKQQALDQARLAASRRGIALSSVPEMGVLKRCVGQDHKLSRGLLAVLPRDIVPIGYQGPGDAA